MAEKLVGSTVDLIKASKQGFSFLFGRNDTKLAKIYHEKVKSYNVTIILNKANKIATIETYEVVQTGPQGVSITKVDETPSKINSKIAKDISEIIEG